MRRRDVLASAYAALGATSGCLGGDPPAVSATVTGGDWVSVTASYREILYEYFLDLTVTIDDSLSAPMLLWRGPDGDLLDYGRIPTGKRYITLTKDLGEHRRSAEHRLLAVRGGEILSGAYGPDHVGGEVLAEARVQIKFWSEVGGGESA
jgi:hypothetical protein